MKKCTRRGQTLCVWGQIYISLIMIVCIVCDWLGMIITLSLKQGPSTISIRWERAQGGRLRGRVQEGRWQGRGAGVSGTSVVSQ